LDKNIINLWLVNILPKFEQNYSKIIFYANTRCKINVGDFKEKDTRDCQKVI